MYLGMNTSAGVSLTINIKQHSIIADPVMKSETMVFRV